MTNAPKLLLSNIPKKYRIQTGDQTSIQVKWIDFDLGTLDTDYPQVKHFLFRPIRTDLPAYSHQKTGAQEQFTWFALPWHVVEAVDWSSGVIRVSDPDSIQPADPTELSKAVLLTRDILDAYVIDLQNRHLRRANDLLLDDSDGLQLKAADTGLRALLRRISGGIYRGYHQNDLQDWKHIEFLRGDPRSVRAGALYHRRIERLLPGEIASLAEGLPYLHAAEEIMLLPHQLAADTMELMTSERQLQVFEELDETYALSILEKMAPDIAADLIGRLPTDQARHYLNRLPKLYSERIIDLLHYPDNSVGGIMTNDMIAVPGDLTVAETRQRLRKELEEPDFIYFLYVVDSDENQYLKGVVTLRNILIAQDEQRLEEIMNAYLQTLAPLDYPRQAAYRMIQNQLAAMPVVSPDGRLLGVVTIDAAVRLVAPGTWRSQAPRIFS